MSSVKNRFTIRSLSNDLIPVITKWARIEGFAPGYGDVDIYSHTDSQGIWLGFLDDKPIGCIAGVRYNRKYGFIGLFIVEKSYRGNGYGLKLWKHALNHLKDIPCIGLEAAPDRVEDYAGWGFKFSSITTRWQYSGNENIENTTSKTTIDNENYILRDGNSIPISAIQFYDSKREPSPRPHFISDWLNHPSGNVLVVVDKLGNCHGFGRIRPCLLKGKNGWRIGPLVADNSNIAKYLLVRLIYNHPGIILIDSPGLNPYSSSLLSDIGFKKLSVTSRMYKGYQPPINMGDVFGLCCLELG